MILQENYKLSNRVEIPKLGLGTWMIDNDHVVAAVKAAIALGYRHIDTAQAYQNEAGVGLGIRESGVDRNDLFVTTKLAAEIKTYDEAVKAIHGSIEALGLDYIDLMIIHSPKPWMKYLGEDRYYEGNREAWRALEEAYKAGKLRAIGLSNFVEEDIEFVSVTQCLARLDEGLGLIRQLLEQERDRGRSGDRWRVVLAGQPNAGKSTLFNRLCGTEGALVSPTRGTTRDWLAASLNWNGLPVELIDTAGQEQEIDSLTGQMQQQRHGQLEQADLVLWCSPASAEASQQQEDAGLLAGLAGLSVPWLQVRTMSDLARSIAPVAPPAAVEGNLTSETAGADAPDEHGPIPAGSVSVSAVTGAGLSQLVNLACARLHGTPGTGDNRLRQMLGSTQSRCRASLQEAMTALDEARTAAAAGAGDELVAMELRAALEELGQVAGSVCTNDLLDRIFSRFCIGK